MDAIELQNRLKNFTHRMVSLCESIPLTDKCRVFEHQLLSFAYAIDAPVQTFRQNVKPLDVSLNVAIDELLQALFHFDIVTKRNLIPVSRVSDLKKQGDVLATMLNAPEIKKQQSNRNN